MVARGIAGIAALLRQQIGLDPESVGMENVAHAARVRLRALGLLPSDAEEIPAETAERYAARLVADPAELDALIERAVVRNSWLFREPAGFAALARFVGQRRAPVGQRLRLLSLGCAAGEEPVSLAVTLLDAGAPLFAVDAVDISEEALRHARGGRFAASAFPAESRALRDRFFASLPGEDAFEARPEVTRAISYHRGNAIDATLLAGAAPYDVVFCRNVLLYFDDRARRATLRQIDRLLRPDGLLVVGTAEAARLSGIAAALPIALVRFEPSAAATFRKRAPTATGGAALAERAPAAAAVDPRAPAAPVVRPAALPRREGPRQSVSGLIPLLSGADHAGCWRRVGLLGGDASCPELPRVITCLGCEVYQAHGRTLLDRPAPPGYAAERARLIASPKDDDPADTSSLTVFRLGREWFALATEQIQRVAPRGAVHSVPFRSGRILRGIANITGTLCLCVSLPGFLRRAEPGGGRDAAQPDAAGELAAPTARMVVIGPPEDAWVFEVDEIDGVTRCDLGALRPAPAAVSGAGAGFTRGVVQLGGRQVAVLDGELIITGLRRAVQ